MKKVVNKFSKFGLLLLAPLVIAVFVVNSSAKADYQPELAEIYSETFDSKETPKQTVNTCQDLDKKEISNCLFFRSIKDGSLYFGNRDKKTYLEGNNRIQGRFDVEKTIGIPQNAKATLKLNQKLEIEKGLDWDTAKVEIFEENNTQNSLVIDIKNTILRQTDKSYYLEGNSFFDISKFDGKNIKISFVFDTVDEKFNNFYGWEIFDFQILKLTNPPAAAVSSSTSSSSSSSLNSSSSSSILGTNTTNSSSSNSSISSNSSSNNSSQSSFANTAISENIVQNKDLVWTKSTHENYPNLKNLWRVDKSDTNNPKLIYNSGTNFETGARNAGNLISNEIVLPSKTGSNNLILSLNSDLKVETNPYWDMAKIVVIERTSGANQTIWAGKTDKSGQISLDLNKFSGKTIYLKFQFDSIDNQKNATTGWLIDSLKIVKS